MALLTRRKGRLIATLTCVSGRSYVVYHGSEIGLRQDHAPEKWYFGPYPVPLGFAAGESFDTFDEAERAVTAWDGRLNADTPVA